MIKHSGSFYVEATRPKRQLKAECPSCKNPGPHEVQDRDMKSTSLQCRNDKCGVKFTKGFRKPART